MANVQDIELSVFDLRVKSGDFCIADSDSTHIEQILLMGKGSLKHSPLTGIGIAKYINSPGTVTNIASFKSKVKAQLEFDGYEDVDVDVRNGISNIKIDAKRI